MAIPTTFRSERFSRALVRGSSADLRYATITQHCLLLEGPEVSIEAVLSLLMPYLREPVTWNLRGAPLTLPSDGCGALILQNVARLTRYEQARLGAWLNKPAHQAQVVSTTPFPLFRLVCDNKFDAALYYRLNIVRCPLDRI
jgi:hypothetical protein